MVFLTLYEVNNTRKWVNLQLRIGFAIKIFRFKSFIVFVSYYPSVGSLSFSIND